MMMMVAVSAVCIFTSVAHADDDCEDAGKLGVMLGQIDRQCAGYRLTDAGRMVMIKMAAKTAPLGGETCAAKGKVAMLQQMGTLFPKVGVAAASGNTMTFNRALCGAIANYLGMLGGEPMIERISN